MPEEEEVYYSLTEKGMAYLALLESGLIPQGDKDADFWTRFELFWTKFELYRVQGAMNHDDV